MSHSNRSGAIDTIAAEQSEDAAILPGQLRVLFAVDSTFPGLGGAEIQALKLARALRENGVSVEFVAPRILPSQASFEMLEDFPLHRIVYPHIRLFGSVVLMVRFAGFLFKHRTRFDCVHVHVTRLLTATAGAVRNGTGLPVVTKISGFFEFEGGVLDMRMRHKPVNMFTRLALKRIDHVQTISKQTREKLIAAGLRDEQISFVPNGIDTRLQAPPMPAEKNFTIGYCGRLREVKGVHVLLEAFAQARKELPEVNLVLLIAGDGETESALKLQASSLDIEASVSFLGRVEDTEDFFARLHLYVQPSFAEGLPNSVIEAMLAARPVLASSIGGNQDLVQDGQTGYLFPAGDARALASLLVKCVDSRRDLATLGAAGRERIVREYGFDRVVRKLMELYRG